MFEEVEDEKGYRFFINRDGKKQKECPLLINIIKNIKSDFGDVKYGTYRCVVKLIKLKHDLNTYCISYRNVASIISKHKNNSSQQSISPKQLTDIVYDVFFATQKAGFFLDSNSFRLDRAVTILTNFLWNIFDSKRMQNISLMELKLTLLILCELEPLNTFNQIIDAHFEIAKDFNHCITKPRFEEFINIFGKVLSYLGEPLYFEQRVISEILTEAFANSPGINGICQYNFYTLWQSHQNTKFSTYTNLFLLLIRFKKSETIIHQNECAGCKKFPIVGLRYKCQKCKGLSLCFCCFSKGFTNKRHSLGHRFFELTSNEKSRGRMSSVLMKFIKLFQRSSAASLRQSFQSTNDLQNDNGNTKLIEDEHIELMQIDDDMECGTTHNRQRRGTIRSEIFNNSENLLILQRNLMDKLLSAIENLKCETEKFKKMSVDHKKIIASDTEFEKYLKCHEQFLCDQVEVLKQIHEATVQSFSSNQNNKTIKSFSTPTKSIFLPSSTPYAVKDNKPKVMVDPILCKSINGYDLNKSYVAKNEEYSISDISTFFQTKMPTKKISNEPVRKSCDLDETESKIENFKKLFKEVKDIIDDSYSDNIKLARTTEKFSKALDQILEEEEKKKRLFVE